MLEYFIIWFFYFILLMLISLLVSNIILFHKYGYNHDNSVFRLVICIIISIILATNFTMIYVMFF